MDFDLRIAEPRDARALARIHSTSWRWAYRDLLPASYLAGLEPAAIEQRWARSLGARRREGTICVAEVDRAVAGFVVYGPHRDPSWLGYAGEVFMLYVDPDRVGRGIGRALLAHATADFERLACRWLVIWVLEHNRRARAFYERAGFRLDGATRRDVIGDPHARVPVVRYARALHPVLGIGGSF